MLVESKGQCYLSLRGAKREKNSPNVSVHIVIMHRQSLVKTVYPQISKFIFTKSVMYNCASSIGRIILMGPRQNSEIIQWRQLTVLAWALDP